MDLSIGVGDVHGDVVVVRPAQICDFGMARFNTMKHAKTGFLGTPAYMAPYVGAVGCAVLVDWFEVVM